jgi:AsmA protein
MAMGKNKKKILWIGGGVVLAFVVLALLVLLFGARVLKPRIEAAASKALKMDVHVQGRTTLSFFPAVGASVADVTVKSGGTDVATIANVTIGLKLLPLMTGQVRISRLKVIKPVVSIVRQKDGTPTIEVPIGKPSGKRLTLAELSISQGSLVFADLRSGGKTEWEGVDITVKDLSAGGTPGADPLKTLSLTGEVRCQAIKTGSFTLTDIEIKAVGDNGVCDISPAGKQIFGGTGSGTLHADFTGTEPHYSLIFAISRLKIEQLLQASPNSKNTEGLAELSGELTARGKTTVEVKRSLSGQVSLTGENILLHGMDMDDLISSLLKSRRFNLVDIGAFFLAGPLGPTLTRAYHFADLFKESQGGKGVIAKLVSVWKFENGVAEAVDVAMATKKRRIAMKGGVNLVDNRFEEAVVAVLDEHGCSVLSQKIHGSFSQPEISSIAVLRSLTSPVTNLVKSVGKLFSNKPCEVFYSGSVPHPEPQKLP